MTLCKNGRLSQPFSCTGKWCKMSGVSRDMQMKEALSAMRASVFSIGVDPEEAGSVEFQGKPSTSVLPYVESMTNEEEAELRANIKVLQTEVTKVPSQWSMEHNEFAIP